MDAPRKDPLRPLWITLFIALAGGYLACVHYGILPLIDLYK